MPKPLLLRFNAFSSLLNPFPLIHGQIRRVVLSRFPYAVYFREQGTEILVIVLHGRQDPRRWKQRI
jgi:plasmid stabilization system protein ParE